MSHVTQIIISFPPRDYEETVICDLLNRFTREIDVNGFLKIKNVGGNKNLECIVLIGSFNYFPLTEFSNFIHSLKSTLMNEYEFDDYYFDDMQIFIKEQDSDHWELSFAHEIKERYK